MFERIEGKSHDKDYLIMVPSEIFGIEHGFWELYDSDTEGSIYYACGTLIFEDGELIDYDGCEHLPHEITMALARSRRINL